MIRILTAAAIVLFASTAVWAEDNASHKAATSAPGLPPAKPFIYKPKATDVVTGKADAPVTMVEYASLSCPHCSHFFINVLPTLSSKYIDTGKVKWVYRDFPLNPPALKAAELVQCAPAESRANFVTVLFKTQAKWAYDSGYLDALGNIAVLGGIDRLKFEHCMGDKTIERSVLDVAKEAADDYQVNSTPTFYINGAVEQGDHDIGTMSKMIDDALAKQGKK